jgi:hypothetical protein
MKTRVKRNINIVFQKKTNRIQMIPLLIKHRRFASPPPKAPPTFLTVKKSRR